MALRVGGPNQIARRSRAAFFERGACFSVKQLAAYPLYPLHRWFLTTDMATR
jgi:hypothetical protein